MAKREEVTMQGVQIRMRNFAGKEGQYNAKGQRNFLVLLNDDVAEQMLADGWNVKYLKPKEEDDRPQPFLKVKVNFDSEPMPRLMMVTSRGKTRLGPDEVTALDWAEITNVDLVIRPYRWDVQGKQGVTAYLSSGFFTVQEDELDLKYADIPDTAQTVIGQDPSLDED